MTSSKTRAVKRGQRSGHCTLTVHAVVAQRTERSVVLAPRRGHERRAGRGVHLARHAVHARQSGRFGVTSSSSTSVASGSTLRERRPELELGVDQLVEHEDAGVVAAERELVARRGSCRRDTPRSFAALERASVGHHARRAARPPPVWPAATFGAPQTIVTGRRAVADSTRQTRSRSASGCGSRLTRARRRSARRWRRRGGEPPRPACRSSSGAPRAPRCTSSSGAQYSRSHSRGTLIRTAPGSASRSRSTGAGRGSRDLQHRDALDAEAPGEPLHAVGVVPRRVGLGSRDVRVDVRVDLAGAEDLQPALALAQVAARAALRASPSLDS